MKFEVNFAIFVCICCILSSYGNKAKHGVNMALPSYTAEGSLNHNNGLLRDRYSESINASVYRVILTHTYIRTGERIFKLHKNVHAASLFINVLLLISGVELNPGPPAAHAPASNFCIGSFNIRSAVHKAPLIHDLINDKNFSILALSETWMRTDDPPAILNDSAPDGYNVLHSPRTGLGPYSRGGGLAIVYRKDIKVRKANLNIETKSFEHQLATITLNRYKFNLLNIYRPPTPSVPTQQFFSELSDLISSIISWDSSDLCICGDLNCVNIADLNNQLLDYNLQQLVNTPTRGDNILDIFAVSADKKAEVCISLDDANLISDHKLVIAQFKFTGKAPYTQVEYDFRSMKNVDFINLQQTLYDSELFSNPASDVDSYANQINQIVCRELDKVAPLKHVKKTVHKSNKLVYLGQEAVEGKRRRRKLEKRWKKTRSESDRSLYRKCCHQVNKLINSSRSNYYRETINSLPRNSRKRWNAVNNLLHNNDKPFVDLPSDFCFKIASCFTDKVNRLQQSILQHLGGASLNSFNYDTDFRDQPFLKFQSVSSAEVKKLINNTDLKHSPIDPFPSVLLKHCPDVFADVIARLTNLSFEHNRFPHIFKKSHVAPLIKKPNLDRSEPLNYRPISNLNTISKLIEKLALLQLSPHILTSGNFNSNQSAYRARHSTETALLKTLSDVYSTIDSGGSSLLVALDISAAFDMIPHGTLLHRLSNTFGITGGASEWLKSYLSDRTQYIFFEGNTSQTQAVKTGVPQGSVLGPLLFTCHISPISKLLESFGISHQQYADDTQIYIELTPKSLNMAIDNLQRCLFSIKDWFSHNGLVINPDKSEALLMSTPQRLTRLTSTGLSSINVAGSSISFSESIRTLGVTLDQHLSFDGQVDSICRAGYYHLKSIRHIRNCITEDDANSLACAFVQSRLDYCNSLLFGTTERNFAKLQRLQNCLGRTVMQVPRRTSSQSVLKHLHWLPIKQRVTYKIASLTFKTLQSNVPVQIHTLLNKFTCTRSARSQYMNTLIKPRTHLALTARSFSTAAPQVWNDLPLELRQCTSSPSFHKQLKSTLFSASFG